MAAGIARLLGLVNWSPWTVTLEPFTVLLLQDMTVQLRKRRATLAKRVG
jgi:hypothetical protein